MNKLNLKLRDNCVWWVCTLVAVIPIAIVLWIMYMLFIKL